MTRQTINFEDAVALKNNTFNRYGYTFDGWESGTNQFTNGQTLQRFSTTNASITVLTAKWIPKNYVINIDRKGGTFTAGDPNSKSISVTYGSALPSILGSITKDGYDMVGLYITDATTGGIVFYYLENSTFVASRTNYVLTVAELAAQKPDNILTLYARWVPITYSINYVLHGGQNNANNPSSYTVESPSINILAPTKNGHEFTGWYVNGGHTKYLTFTIAPLLLVTLLLMHSLVNIPIKCNLIETSQKTPQQQS